MSAGLEGAAVAFLAGAEGTEQSELLEPWESVLDVSAEAARQEDFAGLVLPGGVANPDQLHTDPAAVAFAGSFFSAGKPVAVICHGPWTLVEAGVVQGRVLTSWPSLRTDIVNAGGTWVDQPVVMCENGPNILVSSRRPEDLPAFCYTIGRVFGQGG
jgi:deglycase